MKTEEKLQQEERDAGAAMDAARDAHTAAVEAWKRAHAALAKKAEERPATLDDLRFAATARCPCGAGLAYRKTTGIHGAWDCSAILMGAAIPKGQPGAVQHTDRLPFAFYEIKSEDQPSANGATTRPAK